MRGVLRRTLLAGIGPLLAGACAGPAAPAVGRPAEAMAAQPAQGRWPSFYRTAPAEVQEAYAYAAAHQETLRFIPCYCGCGAGGHRSNADCYVREPGADGWVVLDQHGAACGTCVGITRDVIALERSGMPLARIRAAIDEKWSRTGPGTPTPLPG